MNHYNLTDMGGQLTATLDAATSYLGSPTNNALEFTFGNNLGPDGKIYIAALGGGGSGSFNVTSGYQDGIYAFDPITGQMSNVIASTTEITGPANGPSGLQSPKYVQFDINFSPSPDVGYTVPEPSTSVVVMALSLGFLVCRKRGNC